MVIKVFRLFYQEEEEEKEHQIKKVQEKEIKE